MDRAATGFMLLLAGVLLILGGAYVFLNLAHGGVNPVSVGSFAALVAGIGLAIAGQSMAAAGGQQDFAGAVGLRVKGGLGLGTSERVEMEGEFDGIKVLVSRSFIMNRNTRSSESYSLTFEVPNLSALSFYIGPDSLLAAPIGVYPPKLDTSAWPWANSLAVRAEPAWAAESFFGSRDLWPLFSDFFGAGTCRLDDGAMEFCPASRSRSDGGFCTPDEMKRFISCGVTLAGKLAELEPAGGRS